MRNNFMKQFLVLVFAAAIALFGFACDSQPTGSSAAASTDSGPINAQTPTDAYKSLYAAVKAKDHAKIQQLMSKNTLTFTGFAMEQQKQSLEKVLENGLTATTFADSLPEIRDERVKDNFGAVEVYSQKDNRWEDLPFVQEDGMWKLGVGDEFKGTYQSPGKGQAQKEMEASNPMMGTTIEPMNSNANANVAPSKNKTNRNPVNTAEVPDEHEIKPMANANKK